MNTLAYLSTMGFLSGGRKIEVEPDVEKKCKICGNNFIDRSIYGTEIVCGGKCFKEMRKRNKRKVK